MTGDISVKGKVLENIKECHGDTVFQTTLALFTEEALNKFNKMLDVDIPRLYIMYESNHTNNETKKVSNIKFEKIFILDVGLYKDETSMYPEHILATENYISALIKKRILQDIEIYGNAGELDFSITVEPESI